MYICASIPTSNISLQVLLPQLSISLVSLTSPKGSTTYIDMGTYSLLLLRTFFFFLALSPISAIPTEVTGSRQCSKLGQRKAW